MVCEFTYENMHGLLNNNETKSMDWYETSKSIYRGNKLITTFLFNLLVNSLGTLLEDTCPQTHNLITATPVRAPKTKVCAGTRLHHPTCPKHTCLSNLAADQQTSDFPFYLSKYKNGETSDDDDKIGAARRPLQGRQDEEMGQVGGGGPPTQQPPPDMARLLRHGGRGRQGLRRRRLLPAWPFRRPQLP